jgi:hypothetical protein
MKARIVVSPANRCQTVKTACGPQAGQDYLVPKARKAHRRYRPGAGDPDDRTYMAPGGRGHRVFLIVTAKALIKLLSLD